MRYATGLVLLLALIATTISAPVPDGAQLSIAMQFKDNGNNLRGKIPPPAGDYARPEDGYVPTIWIEGPYDPATSCQMSGFERQNIKYVNTITYLEAHSRDGLTAKTNPWQFHDYDTPDYLAAIISAGKYYYCPNFSDFTQGTESDPCPVPVLAATDVVRQDPSKGGEWCAANGSTICDDFTTPWVGTSSLGDISRIPDGITSATVYPDSQINYTWDLRDHSGALVEEGHYLVYIQMSAERTPREIEGQIEAGGIRVVNLETCWDDPYYDTRGHHRVVNLFEFKDSSFTLQDINERKYSGDTFDYLDTPVSFTYTTPATVSLGTGRAAALHGAARLAYAVKDGLVSFRMVHADGRPCVGQTGTLRLYTQGGRLASELPLDAQGRAVWHGASEGGTGTYVAVATVAKQVYSKRILLAR